MNHYKRRLARMEGAPDLPSQWLCIVVDTDESVEAVVCREFGGAGVPAGAALIVRKIVDPAPRRLQ